jgi:hypothetical protein
VGIGTATPQIKTEIANGGSSAYNLYLSGFAPSLYFGGASGVAPNGGTGQTATGFIALATGAGNYGQSEGDLLVGTQSFQAGNSNAIRFLAPNGDSGNYEPVMSILRSGDVGVGTTAPNVKLEVDTAVTGVAYNLALYNTAAPAVNNTSRLSLSPIAIGASYSLAPYIEGIEEGTGANTMGLDFGTYEGGGVMRERMRISAYGNVGIGTTDPQYPLSVNGTIQAKEVLVNTGWSDYVFDAAYRLAPLPEVAAYVAENHHLPGIPSAAEVAKNGIPVGEMQSKLLAKIEELTLHMIQEDERSARLEQENRDLRRRLLVLEDRNKE